MKKLILPVMGLILAHSASAQIFSESFNTSIPNTWTIIDEDGLTSTSSQSAYASWAWNSGLQDASSSSWYNNSGLGPTSDWLITPPIAIPATGNIFLLFRGASHEATFLEEYEVRVSVGGTTIPEFTTQILNVVNEPLAGVDHSISLNAFLGQTIHIAFHHTSNDESMLHIDNVVVKDLQPNDATLNSVVLNRYSLTSTNNTLAMSVKNSGGNTITSITADWNDGTSHSSTITTNIAPGATAVVNHPTPVSYATANTNDITVSITQVNAGTDPVMADNTGEGIITTLSQSPTKTVLIEEGTGTWCGWCPRGAVAMEYMYNTYPTQFVGIAVHNGDPMTVTAYDNGVDLSGYPGCNVDRVLLDQSVSQAAFVNFYNTRKDLLTPASVGLTANAVGSSLVVDVNATFYSNFPTANYRLGVILVEDGVTGTGSAYNQVNYYAGGANGAMGGYESLPDPVPAAQMVYDHVGRALLGGFDGQVGSVPAVLTDGQTVNYTFNYTIPGNMNANNMSAVAVVIDNASGEVVNAQQTDITVTAGVEDLSTMNMTIFPNPATENLTIQFEAEAGDYVVTITDLSGKVVVSNNYNNISGAQNITFDVASLTDGNYLVSIANSGASHTKMVTIK